MVVSWHGSGTPREAVRDEGLTRGRWEGATTRTSGVGMVVRQAGELISEISRAVEMGGDPVDIGKTNHPHPTLS